MLLKYIDAQGKEREWKPKFFVDAAVSEAIGYGDNHKLLFAIKAGLPELWESEAARLLLALYVETGTAGGKGWNQNKNKLDDERNSKLWELIHYWHGRGLSIWNEDHDQTACHMAAKECPTEKKGKPANLAAGSVHKIYLNIKKSGDARAILAAEIAIAKGKNERVDNK